VPMTSGQARTQSPGSSDTASGRGRLLAVARVLEARDELHDRLTAIAAAIRCPDLAGHYAGIDNPLVARDGLLAYAGVPLHLDGQTGGAVCVFDRHAGTFPDGTIAVLSETGAQVMRELAAAL
jgi:GAF domain-containing protein